MKIDFAKVEINALDFFKLQRLMQWKLWEKLSLGYFWAGTLNKHCHLWNQHLRLCQWVKFHAKQKNFKFRTKISLFSQFSSSLKKLMSHLKSTLSNFWNCKVSSYIKKSFNMNLEVNLDIGFTFSKSSGSVFFWRSESNSGSGSLKNVVVLLQVLQCCTLSKQILHKFSARFS